MLVAARRDRTPLEEHAVRRGVRLAATGGLILVLAGVCLRLLFQLLDFVDPGQPVAGELLFLLRETFWGRIWLTQALLGLVLLVVPLVLPKTRGWTGGVVCGVPIGLSALMPALSGHAVGAGRLAPLAVAADVLHVVGAGLWLGTLAVLLVAARGVPAEHGARDDAVRHWVEPFHRVAMAGVGTVIATGMFATWLHAPSASSLLGPGWGAALRVKLVATAAVLGLGWFAGWRLRPGMGHPGVPQRVQKSALLELVAAQVVLVATAALVSLSPSAGDTDF